MNEKLYFYGPRLLSVKYCGPHLNLSCASLLYIINILTQELNIGNIGQRFEMHFSIVSGICHTDHDKILSLKTEARVRRYCLSDIGYRQPSKYFHYHNNNKKS